MVTFYFFPYLSKSLLPEIFNRLHQGKHIILQYEFKFFFPQFFLQQLALQFWQDDSNIWICKDGFETKLSNGVRLRITRMRIEKPNTQEMKLFVYNSDMLDTHCSRATGNFVVAPRYLLPVPSVSLSVINNATQYD